MSVTQATVDYAPARLANRIPVRFLSSWLGAAILRRELLVTLRSRKPALALLVVVAAASLIILVAWPPDNTDLRNVGRAPVDIVGYVSWLLLGAAFLVLPAIAANTIIDERQRETLDLLKLSLIPPTGLVVAKLLNCVGLFLLIICGIIPVVGTCFFMLGVDLGQFLATLALVILGSMAIAAIGLACSSWFRKPFMALSAAYLIAAVHLAFPAILRMTTAPLGRELGYLPTASYQSNWKTATSPTHMIFQVIGGNADAADFFTSVAIELFITLACVAYAIWQLRRPERAPVERNARIVDDPVVLSARRSRFPFYLIDPLRRRPEIPDDVNPMRVKEMRWGLLGKQTRMVRVFYITSIVAFITSIIFAFRPETWAMSQIAILAMLTPAFVAGAFSKEYELGNMDMLRLTLLNARALIHGKLWAGLLSLSPVLAGVLIGSIPMLIFHIFMVGGTNLSRLPFVLKFFPTLAACVISILAICMFVSVLTRRTVPALLGSYLLSAFALIGVVVPVMYVAMNWNVGLPVEYFLFSPVWSYLATSPTWDDDLRLGWNLWAGSLCLFTIGAVLLIILSERLFVQRRMQDR